MRPVRSHPGDGAAVEAFLRFEQGIEVRFDDTQWQVPAVPMHARDAEPPPVSPASAPTKWIAQRLLAQGLARSATRVPLERAPGARAHALDRTVAPVVRVPLAAGEHAVLLVESERVVAWQLPGTVEEASAGARAHSASAVREAVFVLVEPGRAAVAHATHREHALFGGWLVGALEATILKLVARRAGSSLVSALEGARREGPVVVNDASDPGHWEEAAAFPFVAAPREGPARILLFVHGAFSSVKAGFGTLCATQPGRDLLAGAMRQYGAVWGWDHRTLTIDPAANARRLFEALASLTLARPPLVDIVCHSRGALVARYLIEEVLPTKTWRPLVGRVVFVGGANAGTQLARPANWRALVDLVTNLALAGQATLAGLGAPQVAAVAATLIDRVAEFVGALAEAGLEGSVAPGLAALDPDGAFVRDMDRAPAAGAPPAWRDCDFIESDFQPEIVDESTHRPAEFPRRLALLLANGFVDELMHGTANDLVVDVPSMVAVRPGACEEKDRLDFGRNPFVYHTNYLLQPQTLAALARWLARGAPGGANAAISARPRDPHTSAA